MAQQKPIIAWDNLLEKGTVTASTEATDYAVENAYDGLTWDAWKASADGVSYLYLWLNAATAITCFGYAETNLGTNGGSIKLQRSSDGSTWTDVTSAYSPSTDGPYLETFTEVSYQYYRLVVTSTPASYFGHVFIGPHLIMERGLRGGSYVANLQRAPKFKTNRSEGGLNLGRSVQRQQSEISASFQNLTESWVRTNWEPFTEYAQGRPFLFSWEHGEHSSEVALCMTNEPIAVDYQNNFYMATGFEAVALAKGVVQDPATRAGSAALPVLSGPSVTIASPTTNGELDLSWPAISGAASYSIYRGTASGSLALIASNVTATTYNDVGLSDATTYYYAVSVVNVAGVEGNQGTEVSQKTQPTEPSSLIAVFAVSSIDIQWNASPDETSGYNVYRSTTSGSGFSLLATVSTGITLYKDTTGFSGTTYYYVATALDGALESDYSNEDSEVFP